MAREGLRVREVSAVEGNRLLRIVRRSSSSASRQGDHGLPYAVLGSRRAPIQQRAASRNLRLAARCIARVSRSSRYGARRG